VRVGRADPVSPVAASKGDIMWWMLAACAKLDSATVVVIPADTGDLPGGGGSSATDPLPAPVRIVSFETTCASFVWDVSVSTSSPATEVRVYFDQTGVASPWFEEHVLESDPTGTAWFASLDHVDRIADVVSGETSLYSCDDVEVGRYDTITFVYFALEGDEVAHCVAFGDDPSRYPDCDDGNMG
jgi:hypothetical protein